ncbi:hypothetical protein K491DRAFT_716321 [Lophiostoma macrostomum CBS 122681]|uniref:SAP domain-containing protein n=1 Tax=Lophiostoma macrostomum CBS 122681 TaxID=1314788 RepID=A0A6A6T680_9PLEO|nr:hypothetical protein K491DRAFT_716321 [Lophiostoma macrostomum CBS 122681]
MSSLHVDHNLARSPHFSHTDSRPVPLSKGLRLDRTNSLCEANSGRHMRAQDYKRVSDWVNCVSPDDWDDTATIDSDTSMSSRGDDTDSESINTYIQDCDTCSNSITSSLPGNDIFHDIVEMNDKMSFHHRKLEFEKMKASNMRALCIERGCEHGRVKADMVTTLANLEMRAQRSKHESMNNVIKIQDTLMHQARQAEYMKMTREVLNKISDERGCMSPGSAYKNKSDIAARLAAQEVSATQESMEVRHQENQELFRSARKAGYEAMTLSALRDICNRRGCVKDPSKAAIVERLVNLDGREYYFKQRRKKKYEDIV